MRTSQKVDRLRFTAEGPEENHLKGVRRSSGLLKPRLNKHHVWRNPDTLLSKPTEERVAKIKEHEETGPLINLDGSLFKGSFWSLSELS